MEIYKNLDLLDLDGEIWKEIDGYDDDYFISNFGRIKSFKRYKEGKILKSIINKKRYLTIELNDTPKFIHRLVLETFNPIENIEELQVNHKNGIKSDNRLENLEWCTCSENIKHAFKLGLKDHKGEKHPKSILFNNDVELIKMIFETNEFKSKKITIRYIAKRFNVSSVTISHIKNDITWFYIKIDYKLKDQLCRFLESINFKESSANIIKGSFHHNSILKENDIIKIKKMLKTGNKTLEEIGKIFNVSKYTIFDIKRGKSWKHV